MKADFSGVYPMLIPIGRQMIARSVEALGPLPVGKDARRLS